MWDDDRQRASVRERFKLLLASHRDELAPVQRAAEEGELLLSQGAPARSMLLLTAGRVAVEVRPAGDTPHTLMLLEAEELLGEMGLFGDGHHSTDVRVVGGPAELIEVDGDAFLRAMLFDIDLAIELLALLSRRCQRSNAVIGLLLDGIGAAASADLPSLQAITTAMAPLNPGLATAAESLQRLARARP
jgi:CRP/FNR family transcriptional regulator, cyclic AMP receptor protein